MRLHGLPLLCIFLLSACAAKADAPFGIQVLDAETRRGVPLVELTTTDQQTFITDSAGWAAIGEPDLLGQKIYFHVRSHGYEHPADGFGFRGKMLDVAAGKTATLEVTRQNLAERLYRITGAGIYRDSVLLGKQPPIEQPLLNAQVVGSDSVMSAVYRGRIHWFWGDTSRQSYPLGNFHTTGATSRLPREGGLDPTQGVNFDYYRADDGFVRPMAKVPGDGPTWISGLTVLRTADREERMYAHYAKIRGQFEVYERGLLRWNDEREAFEAVKTFPLAIGAHMQGHTFEHREGSEEYVYFCNPFPRTRVRATPAAFEDPARYEHFTCLTSGSTLERPKFDRNADGTLRYDWRSDAPPLQPRDEATLLKRGLLEEQETLATLRDFETGKSVVAHSGSVAWNEHRKRWILLTVELGGTTSNLGEVWFAEADSPLGPWAYTRRVVTHDKYSFYNPKHHPFFDEQGGRVIYFEGTYTRTFSSDDRPTPRYDYNQVMYRLDLGKPELTLPVAVYDANDHGAADSLTVGTKRQASGETVAFFALSEAAEHTVAIEAATIDGLAVLRVADQQQTGDDQRAPLFHAYPADAEKPPAGTTPLFEFVAEDRRSRVYRTEQQSAPDGHTRSERPLCYVWKRPNALLTSQAQ